MAKHKSLSELSDDPIIPAGQLGAEEAADTPRRSILPPKPIQSVVEDQDEDDSIMAIQQAIKENVDVGGKIRVSRKGPADSGYSYVVTLPPEEFDVDHIKKMYGGGDYLCQTFKASGAFWKKFKFSIDSRFKGVIEPEGSRPAALPDPMTMLRVFKELTPAPVVPVANTSSMEMMMAMMMKSQESMTQILVAAMTGRAQAPAHDGMTIKDVIPLLTVVLPMLKGDNKGEKLSELVATMKALKELASEGADEEKGLLSQLMEAAPALMAGFAAARGNRVTQPQKVVTPPRPVTEPAHQAPPAPAEIAPPGDMVNLNFLVEAARRDADPGLYCDLILDSVPEEGISRLHAILTVDTWFAQLFGSLPEADQLRPWMTRLRSLVLEAIQEDNEPPTDQRDPDRVRPEGSAVPVG